MTDMNRIKAIIRRAVKARTRTFALEHVTPPMVMLELDQLALHNSCTQEELQEAYDDASYR